jgi:tRNA(Ile)-lysidine synthase
MLDLIAFAIDEQRLLPAKGIVVVAVSGGADSLCLLHVLNRLCGPGKRYPDIQLQVAHLNHQLRGADSTRDAAAVEKIAHDWKLPVTIGVTDVASLAAQEHRSLEEAARLARYRFLREVAQGNSIAVAHHQDDQVETLLLHWLRGGGLASMVGLQPRQQDLIRPLLAIHHADTLDYCQRHQIVPVEDASNNDTRFLRNRIRHEILPNLESINPGFRETLLRNAEVLQIDFAWINAQVDSYWPTIILNEQPNAIQLSISQLQKLSLSLQRHLLRRVTAQLCAGQSPLELRHYVLLDQLQQRQTVSQALTLHLPQHLHVTRLGDILSFKHILGQAHETKITTLGTEVILPVPGSAELPGTPWMVRAERIAEETMHQVQLALQHQDWSTVWQLLPSTPYAVYVDAAMLPFEGQATAPTSLLVRTRRDGDRMQPLGMSNEKKVKDILIDRHSPRDIRTQLPLFFAGARCIWLGGIQLDHRVRLTRETRSILRLSIDQRSH